MKKCLLSCVFFLSSNFTEKLPVDNDACELSDETGEQSALEYLRSCGECKNCLPM